MRLRRAALNHAHPELQMIRSAHTASTLKCHKVKESFLELYLEVMSL